MFVNAILYLKGVAGVDKNQNLKTVDSNWKFQMFTTFSRTDIYKNIFLLFQSLNSWPYTTQVQTSLSFLFLVNEAMVK